MNIRKEFKAYFKKRRPDSHKGDYGRILILAGSKGMSGACVLASNAALRSGAGLVTVGVPKSLVLPLAKRFTEAMTLGLPETKNGTLAKKAYPAISKFLKKQDAFAIGPGLSVNTETQTLIRQILLNTKKPAVIDADGLNAFKGKTSLLRKLKTDSILTPHAGEFMRLFGGRSPKTDSERLKKAAEMAAKYQVVLVLKGHKTVVASPRGKVYVNHTGNPGMATGGSGDVLTGIITAFLGQKLPSFLAACFGVYIHGLAGDLAAKKRGQTGLIASDIIVALPSVFKNLENHS